MANLDHAVSAIDSHERGNAHCPATGFVHDCVKQRVVRGGLGSEPRMIGVEAFWRIIEEISPVAAFGIVPVRFVEIAHM